MLDAPKADREPGARAPRNGEQWWARDQEVEPGDGGGCRAVTDREPGKGREQDPPHLQLLGPARTEPRGSLATGGLRSYPPCLLSFCWNQRELATSDAGLRPSPVLFSASRPAPTRAPEHRVRRARQQLGKHTTRGGVGALTAKALGFQQCELATRPLDTPLSSPGVHVAGSACRLLGPAAFPFRTSS